MRTRITQELLQKLYEYRDGKLYYRIDLPRRKKGDCASWVQRNKGRLPRNMVFFEGHNCYLTKLIYLYHHGKEASRFAYVDGNTLNDRIENIVAFHNNDADVLVSDDVAACSDVIGDKQGELMMKYDCCLAHDIAANKWVVHVFEPDGALTSHGSFHTIAEAYAVWKHLAPAR